MLRRAFPLCGGMEVQRSTEFEVEKAPSTADRRPNGITDLRKIGFDSLRFGVLLGADSR